MNEFLKLNASLHVYGADEGLEQKKKGRDQIRVFIIFLFFGQFIFTHLPVCYH